MITAIRNGCAFVIKKIQLKKKIIKSSRSNKKLGKES